VSLWAFGGCEHGRSNTQQKKTNMEFHG
jgi:hypothetical protein